MAGIAETTDTFRFDDRNIPWQPLGDLKHFVAHVYDLDEKRGLIDFILKFEPNEKIILHAHLCQTSTLVIQGEHRIYEPDGSLKEIRKVGSYTAAAPGPAHMEGGGKEGAVIFYSLRTDGGPSFDIMDENGKAVARLGWPEFKDVFAAQKAAVKA